MAKTFTKAPRPVSAIEAYERGGPGHDNAGTSRAQTPTPTEAQTHTPTDVGARPRRLSVDMPDDLHRRFKVACATARLSMVGEVLDFIERRTAELERKA